MGKYRIEPGTFHTLGATLDNDGVNFALFSAHAEKVELCIFDSQGKKELLRFTLPNCDHNVWHGYLRGAKAGLVYGYRVYGSYKPEAGHRFNHHKLLLDPYAKSFAGEYRWSNRHLAYQLGHEDEDLSFWYKNMRFELEDLTQNLEKRVQEELA